jgi:hypothetical protein
MTTSSLVRRKRRRIDEDEDFSIITSGEEPHDDDDDVNECSDDANILSVSEVMKAADVWSSVWKSYMVDLSNRMHQIKCKLTRSSFSDRRPQKVGPGIVVAVHKYKKPDDWAVAKRALKETKDLYEKRVRELLEEAFVRAGVFDDVPPLTYAGICAETARGISARLNVDVANP